MVSKLYKLIVILILALLNVSLIYCKSVNSSEDVFKSKKAYGISKRINTSTGVVVIIPISGVFTVDDDVDIYEKKGDLICKGRIKSVYVDEIYVKVSENDIHVMSKGLIISKNYSYIEVSAIDEDDYLEGLAIIEKSEKEAEDAFNSARKEPEARARSKPPVYYKHYSYSNRWTKDEFHKYCKGCHQDWKKGPTKCDGCHRK